MTSQGYSHHLEVHTTARYLRVPSGEPLRTPRYSQMFGQAATQDYTSELRQGHSVQQGSEAPRRFNRNRSASQPLVTPQFPRHQIGLRLPSQPPPVSFVPEYCHGSVRYLTPAGYGLPMPAPSPPSRRRRPSLHTVRDSISVARERARKDHVRGSPLSNKSNSGQTNHFGPRTYPPPPLNFQRARENRPTNVIPVGPDHSPIKRVAPLPPFNPFIRSRSDSLSSLVDSPPMSHDQYRVTVEAPSIPGNPISPVGARRTLRKMPSTTDMSARGNRQTQMLGLRGRKF